MTDLDQLHLSLATPGVHPVCPLCGWRDGEGVRTCFYSSEVGAVTHQNSMEAALASMPASVRDLMISGENHRPHVCGGHRVFLNSYHYGCTGCDVEVHLWEYGIDYDVG